MRVAGQPLAAGRNCYVSCLVMSHQRDGSVNLPDGSDITNPGITLHWTAAEHGGYPVIDTDDPRVYDEILHRAVG